MKLFKLFFSFFLAAMLLVSSCNKEEDFQYPIATLNYIGFDFSEGITNLENVFLNDGEIVNWRPGSGINDTISGLFWKNIALTQNNEQKYFGEVDLASITKYEGWDDDVQKLMVGHCYVVSCQDGIAKFKVLAVDEVNWAVDIEYYFSETPVFNH